MKLHENKELFEEAILAASQLLNIPEIYIEKDYWVTLVLYEIFHSSMSSESVFKGGTALSKCHKLIERFSEKSKRLDFSENTNINKIQTSLNNC